MTGKNFKIVLFALIVLLCTIFIFSNSLKNIEESRADSDVIVEIVEEICERIEPDNDLNLDYIVRKCAHFTEFFVLGVSCVLLYFQTRKGISGSLCYVFLYVVAVAFCDEFIQRFTGRGSRFTDVMIDTSGAVAGIVVSLILGMAIHHMQKRKKSPAHKDTIQEIKNDAN